MLSWRTCQVLQDGEGKPFSFANEQISMVAVLGLTKLRLQCQSAQEIKIEAITEVANRCLPSAPNEVAGIENPVFWLAPDEWLLVSPEKRAAELKQDLTHTVSGQKGVVIDLSDALAAIDLSGEESCLLLAQGCGIDLDRNIFLTGHYTATRLFQLSVIIHRVGDKPTYRLYVNRSQAEHLWSLLEHNAVVWEGGRSGISAADDGKLLF